MELVVTLGYCSAAGTGGENQDFVGMVTPAGADLAEKGVTLALADGVSGCADGRAAAEYTVRGLLSDYYATPATWDVAKALDTVLQAINRWLLAQGARRGKSGSGLASTLTALVLRGRHFHVAHAGDSRAYLCRRGKLRCLTVDHVWDQAGMQHVLRRAVGLDARLALEYSSEETEIGDVFLLATDGVWAALREAQLADALQLVARGALGAQAAAERLVEAARAAGSPDDASAAVLRAESLPAGGLRDTLAAARRLPVPPRLTPGESLDGLRVEQVTHASAATLLYLVCDPDSGARYAMKTLAPERGEDPLERASLAQEEWLLRRLTARYFPQFVARPAERQSCLYVLSTWHAGGTVQARIDAGGHFTIPEAVSIGERLARALGALHRRGILHRDVTPANVHLGDDGELRLIDFGLALSAADEADEGGRAPRAGTPSYLAPEQIGGAPPSAQTDLYAAGVTLYRALTRRYPYGEIEPFQTPRFGEPVSPARYRPDIPAWLEQVVLRAVARTPAQRFETAEELLLALERGAARPLAAPRRMALAERDPLRFWKSIAAAQAAALLLLLFLLLH